MFTKDIYHAYALKYLDNIDNGSRIEQLLRDVPKKDWTDEPVISIIGPMANMKFIKYLIRTLALQTDLAKYGRPQIFAFMTPRDYSVYFFLQYRTSFLYKIFCRFLPQTLIIIYTLISFGVCYLICCLTGSFYKSTQGKHFYLGSRILNLPVVRDM